jgi:phosphatidate cytidylyltransferase
VAGLSPYGQRVLTAALLIPLVVWGVLTLETRYVAVGLGAVVMAGAWEWGMLMAWTSRAVRAAYAAAFVPLLYTAYRAVEVPAAVLVVLAVALVWWLIALVLVMRFERGVAMRRLAPVTGVVAGWLLLLPPWVALVSLHAEPEHGPALVMLLLGLIWLADSGAYVAGRRWGRRRLAPRVSPGKSWEGVAGGLAAAGLLALAAAAYGARDVGAGALFVLVCLAVACASVLGDLAESLFKRQAGVKDSGTLVPGHGGVLDRIDSLTAAAPLFAMGMRWLGM